jgi:TolB-like protein/Flp pilus assembly protein TadD/class 3 adenylate cyclase
MNEPHGRRPEDRDAGVEIGHVLFVDIVGYSKRLVNEQSALVERLKRLVRGTEQFRKADAADKLITIPTGDGMALVFFTAPDAPVRCAIEINKADQEDPKIELRMGIHSGPVDRIADVNERINVAGAGINLAQRVMDCGDAGHILLSKRSADDLAQYDDWKQQLHDLGEMEVKHGVRVGVVNFYNDEIGNPKPPEKLTRAEQERQTILKTAVRRKRRRILIGLVALGIVAALAAAGTWAWHRRIALASAYKAGAAPLMEKSIAVLPFENLSAEKDDAFFADGIQDDVLASLGKIKDLKVIARSSVMTYRGAAVAGKLREIGQALQVSHVLQGSVRRAVNRVVINVALIDTRTDSQLWSQHYDRTLSDMLSFQGELAVEIARELQASLTPKEKTIAATSSTTNPDAYVLFLKARDKEHTAASKEDAFAIDDLYGQAVVLDPKFALALARQATWNSIMYQIGRRPENKAKAHALAREALRVAPDLAEAHFAQGICLLRTENDSDAAFKEFSIAAQTMSNDPELLGHLAVIYRRQGRWREALATFQRVAKINPRNADPYSDIAATQTMLRDWPGAEAHYRRALEIDPKDFRAIIDLASVSMFGEGNFAAAKALLRKVPDLMRDSGGRVTEGNTSLRWELCMLERDFADAEKVLVEYPAEEFPPPSVADKTLDLGCTALARGDATKARVLFEKARPLVEAAAREHPDDPVFRAPLGLLYAYLGRKEEALRESRRAVELGYESKNATQSPAYLNNLALVYAVTGEAEQAVTLLEYLLVTPAGNVTLAELRLSWRWDPLRKNPGFKKIVESPEPKTVY